MVESSILIICDEPTTSRIWALCVTELHCRPMVANSIEQAVNIIEESSPDLIVVDVTSRSINGIQMCHDLRKHANARAAWLSGQWDILASKRAALSMAS